MVEWVWAGAITVWFVWGGYEAVSGRLLHVPTLMTLLWWGILFTVVFYFGASAFHLLWIMPLIYLMAKMVTVNTPIQSWVMSIVMMSPLMVSLAVFS